MPDEQHLTDPLSPWWRNAVILVLILGFSVLIWVAVRSYKDAPPIPENVVGGGRGGASIAYQLSMLFRAHVNNRRSVMVVSKRGGDIYYVCRYHQFSTDQTRQG